MRSANKTKCRLLLWWLGSLLPAVLVPTLLQANDAHGADRVILVGDIHGDADRLRGLLRRAALLSDDDRWVVGKRSWFKPAISWTAAPRSGKPWTC